MDTTPSQVVQNDTDVKALEKVWGVSRNTIKAWAKALGVELKRPNSTTSLWPGERLQDGMDLADWVDEGKKLGEFPIVAKLRGDVTATTSITASKKQDLTAAAPANEALAVLAEVLPALQPAAPAVNPIEQFERIRQAASIKAYLTGEQMGELLGYEIRRDHDESQPFPGITLHRVEHNTGRASRGKKAETITKVLWWLEDSSSASVTAISSAGTSTAGNKQVGFLNNFYANDCMVDVQARPSISFEIRR